MDRRTITYREDMMLKCELEGYLAYSAQVKYRLIPFVWQPTE